MSGGAKATIPTTAATPTDTATATAATTVSGPLSDSSFGELEECQHVPPPIAAPEGLKEAIGAAGLAAYSTPLHLTGGGVEERPQRVSRVLQRLCGCSWASAQRLLRLKEAFVVSRERSPAEHLKQVNDARHRKRTACGARLQPGSTLYYPRNSSNNSSESSSNTSEEHNCRRQPYDQNETPGCSNEKAMIITFGKAHKNQNGRRMQLPIPLTAPGLPCSGAALLCRSRSAASVVRKAIARGAVVMLPFNGFEVFDAAEASPVLAPESSICSVESRAMHYNIRCSADACRPSLPTEGRPAVRSAAGDVATRGKKNAEVAGWWLSRDDRSGGVHTPERSCYFAAVASQANAVEDVRRQRCNCGCAVRREFNYHTESMRPSDPPKYSGIHAGLALSLASASMPPATATTMYEVYRLDT
ncbi:RNA pseudouridylate synthase domain-containing protein, putative [Eimeria mitis]|uniref:RNA pseudouridylate synthase domain-containing protein, putative n=1 Tax=Eimeria mitis TaxID=44415 RepID=U6K8P4_9EIME|nr:RNA pseudouridylate synthase domain-containing protein, putative [Eimeria mitis]CDJ34375.1 RNA pseudouridylate synthase domain-containing protein, putative [Eimeria mitis]